MAIDDIPLQLGVRVSLRIPGSAPELGASLDFHDPLQTPRLALVVVYQMRNFPDRSVPLSFWQPVFGTGFGCGAASEPLVRSEKIDRLLSSTTHLPNTLSGVVGIRFQQPVNQPSQYVTSRLSHCEHTPADSPFQQVLRNEPCPKWEFPA